MPKVLLDFLGYTFYFYSSENGEPIHIHVSKGKPSNNSAKFWIKRNLMNIFMDLKKIQKYICANRAQIVNRWYEFFGF